MANPKWFDADVYMQNKLVQMQASDPAYTMTDLVDAFAKAGYVGPEGYYAHFVQYGADEDVAPNAFFNAQEYYTAKAAQYYGEAFTGSELQVAEVKALIQAADMNAWTHYQQYGSAEGVDPSNAFDASAYCAAKALAMNDAGLKDAAGNDWTADSIKTAIDQAGMSVLEHYLTYAGTGEGEVAAGSTYPVADDDQVPNPGETVVVDGTATTYTGTAGDDTFYVDTKAELQEYNTLDGGEGNDTLVLNNQAQAGTIKNIENLVVRNATVNTPYDLSAFSSSFTLDGGSATVKNVTSQKLIADGATQLTVNMAAGQTSVDLTSQDRATQALTVVLSGDSLTSVKLAMDEGAEAVSLTGAAKVTDLAVTATASAAEDDAASINAEALTNLANVTVAGAGAVELTIASSDKLETVNATDNTGGVTVDLSDAGKAAFTGGAGDDELTVKGSTVAHTLGAGDDTVVVKDDALGKGFSVDGGEGTDTLAMSADLANGFADADAVAAVATNFEILQLTGSSSESTVDMGNFGGIDHVVVGEGTWGGKLTLNDMANGGTLEYAAAPHTDGVEVTIKDADVAGHDTDVLNVTIAADDTVAAGTLTVADVETIKITADDTKLAADGAADTHTMTLTANAATTVNISGNAGLGLTLTDSNAITKIDASGNTGGLTVDLSEITNAANAFVTLTGSSADDTITMGIGNVITGGEGKDAFTATAAKAADATVSFSTIMDFGADDTLQIGGSDTDGVQKVVVTEEMTFDQAVDTALAAVTSEVAWFEYKGNTYVVADNDGKGDTFDAGDYIVKLNGIVDLNDAVVADGLLTLPEGA